MQTNNQVLNFLQEMLQRLFTKSPMFFKVWVFISSAFVLITGVPDFLSMFHVQIPNLWNEHVTQAVAWSSRAMLFMSALTTQSKPTAITEDGTILKKTDEKKLPFTAKNEANVASKTATIEPQTDVQLVTPLTTKT